MKKRLMILLLILPCVVSGITCDVVQDTHTTNERTLTCDAEKRKVTTFSFSSEIIPELPDIIVDDDEDEPVDVQTYNYDYTGAYQTFVAPTAGYYQLEVWGAQGGKGMMNGVSRYEGGFGGYSRGTIYLNEGQKLFIYVGGKGEDAKDRKSGSAGGFNGGGNGGADGSESGDEEREPGSGGGGATHIATVSGYLSTFSSSNIDELLIVAGGGGGSTGYSGGDGGNAGGYHGVKAKTGTVEACRGTQSSGYMIGHGQSGKYSEDNGYNTGVAGGGGGFYGGCAVNSNGGGGSGGSGYIGNADLKDKVMYCYGCDESSSISVKTISVSKSSKTPQSGSAKEGNGYARITFVKGSDKENGNNNGVVDNSVCKITCEEEVIFSIDPIKKVLAGTGFSYPLYASGERKCTAVYNYQQYEEKIKTLLSEYNSLTGTAKQKKANEITNYYAQKKSCDEFNLEGSEYYNEYKFDGDVSVKLEVSENGYVREETIPYQFVNIEEYDNDIIVDEIYYAACNYNESSKKCIGDDSTIVEWTSTSRIFGKYTMNDVYLEKYTGKITKTYNNNNTCNAGDVYFTDFTAMTRPKKNSNNDKGYKITLIADNIGNNLGVSSNKWKLNVNCWYQVKNLILPQGGPGENEDENYEKYGNTVFQYRLIDLNNPFPGREAGANWKGKENIISDKNDRLSTLERFVITLSRSSIKDIREYNSTHKYDNYDFDEENKSNFIITHNEIIDRK